MVRVFQKLGLSGYDKRLFASLLSPSWISGLLCVLIAAASVTAVALSTHFRGSLLEQQVRALRALNADSDISYYGGSAGFTLDSILNTAVVFIAWALIGSVLYMFAVGLVHAFKNAKELEHELQFVNAHRDELVTAAIFRFAVRAVVAFGWFMYLRFFLGTIASYCASWLYTAATAGTMLPALAYGALAFAVLVVGLHVHIVLLRLLVLRPRLFHNETYV